MAEILPRLMRCGRHTCPLDVGTRDEPLGGQDKELPDKRPILLSSALQTPLARLFRTGGKPQSEKTMKDQMCQSHRLFKLIVSAAGIAAAVAAAPAVAQMSGMSGMGGMSGMSGTGGMSGMH
jgi:hypothetical protein